MSAAGSKATLDEVYAERNLAALVIMKLARDLGWRVGFLDPDGDSSYACVFVDTPDGQVSWHIPSDEFPDYFLQSGPFSFDKWDGHDHVTKTLRLCKLLTEKVDER